MISDTEWFLSDNEIAKRHEILDGKYLGDADADELIALVMDIDADRTALLERGRRLAEEYQPLACFWELLIERLFDGIDIDPSDIYELGEDSGLLIYEQYDPQGRHKSLQGIDATEGDYIYLLRNMAEELDAGS